MKKPMSMLDDPRPIRAIACADGEAWQIADCGVTEIVCYREAGQGGDVPWFVVYDDNCLKSRVNAALVVEVYYGYSQDDDSDDE